MKKVDNILIRIAFVFVAVSFLFSSSLKAEDGRTYDYGAILEAGVSKKFNKTLQISLEEEIRTREYLEQIDRLSTGVGITYNFRNLSDLKFGLRYNLLSYFEDNRIDENRHRFAFQVQYKYSYAGFDFSLRSRILTTLRDESRGSYKVNPKYLWRNRLNVAYNIYGTPYEPYASVEISNTVARPDGNYIERLRYRAGCEYRLTKAHSLDFFFRYTHDINQKEPEDVFSIGVGYNFKL